jgi:hypothetical protein
LIRLCKKAGATTDQPKPNPAPGAVPELQKGWEIMSTIQDVSAEQLAKLFHHYREALAHGCEGYGSEENLSSWDRATQHERKLMVAAARLALLELATTSMESKPSRKYFAKPGEAEWGC